MKICKIYSYLFFMFFMISFMLSIFFIEKSLVYFFEFNLFSLNSSYIVFSVLMDWMSLLFMGFVFFISSMVIYYSESYMKEEKNLSRFILLVVLFVFSMMLMIMSPNLISILLGWDGLGLVSYCLVIFYQNVKSFNAGMLTVLSNRIGDVMILISIAWMLNFGSWNFIFYLDLFNHDELMKIIGLLVLIAAMTKSAQIPFSSWLPAAMAAPTPVSALVHSSTLVTAGVYLLIRFHMLMSNFQMFLLFISLLTMFMSGLSANFEFDLKKIIALSTLSQLGFMMMILSLGEFMMAFFHLLVHALFKALLFMCAGSIIHNMFNNQDIRYMGMALEKMPVSMVYFNLSNLSLCGLPFFSGFYSKDLVAEFLSMEYLNMFIYLFFFISIGLTVCYSFRLSMYSLLMNFNFFGMNILNESSKIMLKSMGLMMFVVIFSGSFLSWLMFEIPYMIILPLWMKFLTLIFIFFGILIGMEIANLKLNSQMFFLNKNSFLVFLSLMWNMPFMSTFGVNFYFLKIGSKMVKFIDQGWFEFVGSQNLFNSLKKSSSIFQFMSKNDFKIYLILIICWFLLLVLFYI
uniref:NADH-ubiquinone oxidoreductase chain 5 n=1 Tax=Coleoptera sp. ACP-2013 TaxID=2485033 RepID=A0A3G3ME73_9COLE|nr:NADH dehydrogenase subunit 5 [Coleoptera sp. ACP-2013]